MSAATCGTERNPGCRFAHPGYNCSACSLPMRTGVIACTEHPAFPTSRSSLRGAQRRSNRASSLMRHGLLRCAHLTSNSPRDDADATETPGIPHVQLRRPYVRPKPGQSGLLHDNSSFTMTGNPRPPCGQLSPSQFGHNRLVTLRGEAAANIEV